MNRIENPRARDIHAAAEFVAAQPGGPDRLLSRHRRMPDGTCASCVATPTPWPCITAVIAKLAHHLLTTARQQPPRPAAPTGEQTQPASATSGSADRATDHHSPLPSHLPARAQRRQRVRPRCTRRNP